MNKAAKLILLLGKQSATKLYQLLTEDEVRALTEQISNTGRIDQEEREQVLKDFYNLCLVHTKYVSGNYDEAEALLISAFGEERARQIMSNFSIPRQANPFNFLHKFSVDQLSTLCRSEHPMTVAIILQHIPPLLAAAYLQSCDSMMATDLITMLSNLKQVSTVHNENGEDVSTTEILAAEVKKKAAKLNQNKGKRIDGFKDAVEILKKSDRATTTKILESIDLQDAELAEKLRMSLFLFEDLLRLPVESIRLVCQAVKDKSQWSIALRGQSKELLATIQQGFSQRGWQDIIDDMSIGVKRASEVSAAQQLIVNSVLQLEADGKISLHNEEMF